MDPENAGCVNTPPAESIRYPINFVLIGNEMNPNGGFLPVPGLNLPAWGIPSTAGPRRLVSPNYMQNTDGFADFPHYPSISWQT